MSKKQSALFFLFCLFCFQPYANAREIRISRTNSPFFISRLAVHSGEEVFLSADIWDTGGVCTSEHGCALRTPTGEFLWSSDNRVNSVCDPYANQTCMAETDFQVQSGGVSFHFPQGLASPITITVRERGGELSATVILNPQPVAAIDMFAASKHH